MDELSVPRLDRSFMTMRCLDLPPAIAARSVGDPIDAITGEVFDSVQDFRITTGAMPIEWHRTYSTARLGENRGLGRGHSHSFDHRLKLDLDGIRYLSPLHVAVDFPAFYGDATRVARTGYVLTRNGSQLRLQRPDDHDLVFETGSSPAARLIAMRGKRGTIHVNYDRDARIASLVDDEGNVVSFAWEGEHIVSARLQARAAAPPVLLATYRYDGDLLVEMEDAYKGRVNLAYDGAGRLIQRTDRNDYSFHFRYDADGRCVHSAGDDGVLEVSLEYLPLDYRTRVTKSDGGVWEYHYDAAKNLVKVIEPGDVTRELVPRPEDGQIAIEVDGAGNEIVHEYDADGRHTGKRDSLGRSILPSRGHALPARPIEYELGLFATVPEELPTRVAMENTVPPTTTALLVVAPGPGAGRVRDVRDVQGLLVRQECDGRSKRYAYDQGGNLRWKIDFDGAKTEWVHASDDHRVSKTDPNGFVTRLEYTKESELASASDPHHTRTVFARDKHSRLVGVSRANAWKERYRRDGAGRLIEKIASNGASLYTIKRGPQGEVLERLFASGGFERFEYDRSLRVIGAETPAGKQSFTYDFLGQRTSDLREGKGVRRRFHGSKLLEQRVLESFVTRYRHVDTADAREVVVTDPTGREHRLRDHRFGVVTRELASGCRETAQYHPNGNCLVKVVDSPRGTSWTRRYEYSGEGYLVARHDSAHGTTRYRLDAAHRLIGEERPNGERRVFQHDAAGNLLEHAGRRATYHAGNALADSGVRRYEHDHRQAVCTEAWSGGYRRFHRDERDQLVRVESFRGWSAASSEPRTTWTARYDALNRRVEKTMADETTVFYWDTDRLAGEVLPSGRLRVFVYADALAMAPMLFVDYASVDASPESGVVYSVFADHLGCPERIEDMAGTTVWEAVIAPYGAAEIAIGADFHQPTRWPGHYYDADLGLQYNRFRTYSPELGRYLEPDPLGRAGGLENVYAYTKNPLFRVDVDGLCPNSDEEDEGAKKKADEEGKPDEEGASKLLSAEEIEAIRAAADKRVQDLKEAGLGDSQECMDARRERYLAECQQDGRTPLPRDEWDVAAQTALANGQRGKENETAALDALGLDNNNAADAKTYDKPDGTKTRPDADNKTAAVDVKSVPDGVGPDGKPRTVYNTDQLAAQRDGAQGEGKNHVVIISNGDKDNARPSGPLGAEPPAGSTVLHHDPNTGDWSKWDPAANNGNGGWQPSDVDTAKALTGGK